MDKLFAADLLLVLHVSFVAFVIFGLVLTIIGKLLAWSWVRIRWFRVAHLICIGIVVVQSWLGLICPLTTWEMRLREQAGDVTYQGSFISHWLGKILYYQAPAWVFVAAYSVFAVLVIISWFWIPPRRTRRTRHPDEDR